MLSSPIPVNGLEVTPAGSTAHVASKLDYKDDALLLRIAAYRPDATAERNVGWPKL
jgi:hypothetical protein